MSVIDVSPMSSSLTSSPAPDGAVFGVGTAPEVLDVPPATACCRCAIALRSVLQIVPLHCRWAWCLPCGFGSVVPYFYVIYFGILLGELSRSRPLLIHASVLATTDQRFDCGVAICSAPGSAGWPCMQAEIWKGVGQVYVDGQISHRPAALLRGESRAEQP